MQGRVPAGAPLYLHWEGAATWAAALHSRGPVPAGVCCAFPVAGGWAGPGWEWLGPGQMPGPHRCGGTPGSLTQDAFGNGNPSTSLSKLLIDRVGRGDPMDPGEWSFCLCQGSVLGA